MICPHCMNKAQPMPCPECNNLRITKNTYYNPLKRDWQIAAELGQDWPQETVYVISVLEPGDERYCILFKAVPLKLAEHIVDVHNKVRKATQMVHHDRG